MQVSRFEYADAVGLPYCDEPKLYLDADAPTFTERAISLADLKRLAMARSDAGDLSTLFHCYSPISQCLSVRPVQSPREFVCERDDMNRSFVRQRDGSVKEFIEDSTEVPVPVSRTSTKAHWTLGHCLANPTDGLNHFIAGVMVEVIERTNEALVELLEQATLPTRINHWRPVNEPHSDALELIASIKRHQNATGVPPAQTLLMSTEMWAAICDSYVKVGQITESEEPLFNGLAPKGVVGALDDVEVVAIEQAPTDRFWLLGPDLGVFGEQQAPHITMFGRGPWHRNDLVMGVAQRCGYAIINAGHIYAQVIYR